MNSELACGICHGKTFIVLLSPDGKELIADCFSCSSSRVSALDGYGLVVKEAEFAVRKDFPLDKVVLANCLIKAESVPAHLNPDSNGNIIYGSNEETK